MEYLSELSINSFIRLALAEDISDKDHSSEACIKNDHQSKGVVLAKDKGIIAGISLAERILLMVSPEISIVSHKKDGEKIDHGDALMTIEGNTKAILKAERLLLNCMQRMSGIATYTYYLSSLIAHTSCKLLDTRKTTPNFRIMEKWAVLIGGGHNHRFNLSDMIMLKDNHVDNAGGITQAIQKTTSYLQKNDLNLKIEIETRDLKEVKEAVETTGVDRIMLDNFNVQTILEALKIIPSSIETEVSGGVNEHNIIEFAETGVDYISVGALTHSFRSLDISLKAKKL